MMFFETIRIAVLNGLPMECQGKSGTRAVRWIRWFPGFGGWWSMIKFVQSYGTPRQSWGMGTNLNNRLLPWKVCIDEMVFTSLMNCEFGDFLMSLSRIHQLRKKRTVRVTKELLESFSKNLTWHNWPRNAQQGRLFWSYCKAWDSDSLFFYAEFNTESCHIFWYVLDCPEVATLQIIWFRWHLGRIKM